MHTQLHYFITVPFALSSLVNEKLLMKNGRDAVCSETLHKMSEGCVLQLTAISFTVLCVQTFRKFWVSEPLSWASAPKNGPSETGRPGRAPCFSSPRVVFCQFHRPIWMNFPRDCFFHLLFPALATLPKCLRQVVGMTAGGCVLTSKLLTYSAGHAQMWMRLRYADEEGWSSSLSWPGYDMIEILQYHDKVELQIKATNGSLADLGSIITGDTKLTNSHGLFLQFQFPSILARSFDDYRGSHRPVFFLHQGGVISSSPRFILTNSGASSKQTEIRCWPDGEE